jgi:GNAT superfamily N-acetyltransferase
MEATAIIKFSATSATDHPAVWLLDAAEATLAEMYGPPAKALPREEFLPPRGGYVVGTEDGRAIAGVGFTGHDDTTAEIRRMYVVPEARSRGVARQLLSAVERAVRAAGYRRVILDTGPKQPHAEALYRSAGYIEIDNYRGPSSRGSYWGSKILP